jgi:hypothetical protein
VFGPIYRAVLYKEQGHEQKHDQSQVSENIDQFVMVSSVLHHLHMMNNRTHLDQTVLQLCLPKAMVPQILMEMHDAPFSGHFSTTKTYGRILHRYFWMGMYEDIKNYCQSCVVCSRRKTPHRIGNIPVLSPQLDRLTEYGPMECIAMDIIRPITMSTGQITVILTMVDLYTRWGQAYALRQQKTKNIAETFIMKWVCMYGFPRTIVSDNGPGFASQVMKDAMASLGIKIHFILPYHPQANGACERLNETLVNMLSSYTQDAQNKWADYLPFVVFAYNTSVHTTTGFTPYRLLCGREAAVGSEAALRVRDARENDYPAYVRKMQQVFITSDELIGQRVRQAADIREAINDAYRSITSYDVGDKVFVYWPPKSSKKDQLSRKLMSPYRGPFTVSLRYNMVSYQVTEDNTGQVSSVHVSRMKKAVTRDAALVAHGDDAAPLTIHNDEKERDLGVHEYTRAQRMQRAQHPDTEARDISVRVPSSARVSIPAIHPPLDDDLEDGEVPHHLVHSYQQHRQ